MARTFDQFAADLDDWALEPIRPTIRDGALNDAIEKLWMKVMLCNLSNFMGGPVTLSVAAASERTQIVSVSDPVSAPVLAQAAGGALAQHTVHVQYTLATESGSETLPSPESALLVLINQLSSVAPPTPNSSSVGYNVYAGSSLALIARQNSVPIPFDQSFYEPPTGYVDFGTDGAGPAPPTENSTADDVFYIKSLEVPLSTGGYKCWEQSSIDSTMFRLASRSIASTSEYQSYYFDLVNQRTLEYRPALGQAFSPRYFFVHKPRRITVGRATLPFTAIPHEEFLKAHSLAYIFAALKEWDAHTSWLGLARTALQDVMETITQQNWNKNNTVVPYRP